MIMRKNLVGSVLAAFTCLPLASRAAVDVAAGAKIAFLGDSITQNGNSEAGGYVLLVMDALQRLGVTGAVKQPAGVSGNRATDMSARIDSVLAQKPDIMTFSVGVNDIWWGPPAGETRTVFESEVNAILDKAAAAGVRVILMTTSIFESDTSNTDCEDFNAYVAGYNDFLRGAAATRGLGLADVNATMWASREAISPSATARTKVYTRDGVHMNSAGAGNYGNVAMAAAILNAMGATDADFAALVAADSATWGSLEKITVATKAASGTAPVTTGGSAASPVNLVTLVRESGHPPVTGGWSSNTARSERRVYDGGSVDDTFSRCMCYLDGSGTYTFNYAIADDFNPDGDFVVTSYRIVPSTDTGVARQPKDFALYGSNNGWQTQSLIHSAEGVTDFSAAFAVPAPKSYRAYRLVVTRTQGDSIVSIADLEFNGYATATKTTPDVLSTLTVVVNSKGGDELGRRVIDNIGAGESWSWDLAELLGDKDVKSATVEGAGASISDKVLTVSNITATETVTVTIELDVYEGGTEPIDLTRLLRREETEISYAGTTVGNASYPAKYALDGDPDTQCLLTVGTEANPAIYAFQVSDAWRPGEKVRLTSFDLLCAGYTPEGRMPKDFTLQAKNESSGEWQIVGSWTGVTGWASGQSKTFEIEHPINSRAYRFVVTKGGKDTRYCTFAEVTLYGTVNDDGKTHLHSWESISETPASCVAVGSRTYICPCGESDEVVLPMTDHTPGEWEVEKAATDTEEGLEVVKCTVCETVLDSRVIPVQGEASDLPTADTIELVAPMREAGALSYSSPGSLGGYGPELAFDGNNGTHWLGNNANVPCYLTVTVSDDFNEGKGVRVRRVSLYNDMESRAVTNFNFQGSVDGTDWMTLASYDGALWNNLELEVASPDFYKSYRIEVNNPRRNYYHCIAEIKLYGELRDPLLAVPATVPNAVYDGDHAYCPDIEVRSFATGEVLQPGKGTYRLEWANNTTLGTATVRIIGREAYAGDIYERSFKIVPAGWTEGDVFVATDGNDIEGDGSPEKPYATVSKGVTAATAGHTVFLKTGTYRSSGQISIGKALAIRGTLPDREATVFSGDSDSDGEPDKPGFRVSANVKVAFSGFTIEKCYNTGSSTPSLYGPALCLDTASCDVSLSNMCLRASGTSGQGNLAWIGGGTIAVVDCAIVDNVKATTGALFHMRAYRAAPTLTMRNCIATNNTCYILASAGKASVTDSLFEGNRGGVIALNGGCTVDRCRFIGNAAAKYGSAGGASIIYFDAGKNAVRNSLFRNSTGGSLFYFWTGTDLGATFDNGLGDYVQNCTFQDNSSGTTDNYSQTKKANWFIENCFFYRTTGSKPTMGGFLAGNQRNNYIFDVGAKSPFVEGTETGECRYSRHITNAGYLRSGIESETDLVGAPRVQDGRVDLGCRERKPNGLVLMVR